MDVLPWPERKSRRGRPKVVDTSIAYDRQHLHLYIQWGLAYYYFCRPHRSLTTPIRDPSKRRYRAPVMAANLVRERWLVQDLLQLPVPEGILLDSFPAAKGCR